ncbi:hypothetical protein AFLA_006231 [Aspergillus flavus NRRL3357]|nr:hypothetical protein AFLA_006231 [Aspergillus flavus NRRL3357]
MQLKTRLTLILAMLQRNQSTCKGSPPPDHESQSNCVLSVSSLVTEAWILVASPFCGQFYLRERAPKKFPSLLYPFNRFCSA